MCCVSCSRHLIVKDQNICIIFSHINNICQYLISAFLTLSILSQVDAVLLRQYALEQDLSKGIIMQTKLIDYKLADLVMEGFLAHDASTTASRPLVLLVHDWSGQNEFVQERAIYFAKQGFVAFALDLYGKGKRGSATDKGLNQKLMGELMQDRGVIVSRIKAALECAAVNAAIDPNKIMAIGFCMGGLAVLDYARSGADIAGVVSVHGLLHASKAPTETICAKVLVLQGRLDPMVNNEQLQHFEVEMTENQADWQIHMFGNTYHAFTNPKADDIATGLLYSAIANQRTWDLVKVFSNEIFGNL